MSGSWQFDSRDSAFAVTLRSSPYSTLTTLTIIINLLLVHVVAVVVMYIYDLATTGSVSYSDFLVTTDLVSQVSQTTQLRARLRAVLKENRAGTSSSKDVSGGNDISTSSSSGGGGSGGGGGAEGGGSGTMAVGNASDWLTIVKTIEEYLPHLLAVFNSVQTDDLILRYEPIFSWRTSISTTRFRGPQRVDLPGLHYELASTLITYALTLSNFAAATVAGLGGYERDRSTSAEQRKLKDDRLRWAADTLCRASGILLYLSQELLPKWRDYAGQVDGLPPDLTTEATLALSKVCLAEAQALAIRKLVSPWVGKAVDTVTPGPPLEKGHPSASLLAKLHLSVVEELESAVGLLRTVSDKGKRGKGKKGAEEMGLSANHEHDLARRVSATRDRGGDDEEEDDRDAMRAGGSSGGKGKKLFSKLKLGGSSSNKHTNDTHPSSPHARHSGPHDAAAHITTGGGSGIGGNSFYAAPTSTLDKDLDISSSLLKYLTFSSTFHRATAYKWLAIDKGEHSSSIGPAIAYLSLSHSLLSSSHVQSLASSLSNISISSSSSSSSFLPFKSKTKKAGGIIIDQELATVQHWLQAYRKLNDTVSFQPVPPTSEVTAKVPAGRAALGVKPFQLPVPVWGPGSDGYVGRAGDGGVGLALDQLHLLDSDHPARRNLVAIHTGAGRGEDEEGSAQTGRGGLGTQTNHTAYAGQGAYY
ncbi:hypothetical protein EX895_002350 [Sporisorium graminicola]|uniref:pH-response regulator protein palC n=1 Tax=Sporisorium graminicola TaxID=280036 RepID=A0A4V6EU11_9BASI|nr:hypothetical protein EX895_002350 [Sporisorium graminicola]TKY88719.1 hypothetical protein EX895_002350 [Sporisorium graminicola]